MPTPNSAPYAQSNNAVDLPRANYPNYNWGAQTFGQGGGVQINPPGGPTSAPVGRGAPAAPPAAAPASYDWRQHVPNPYLALGRLFSRIFQNRSTPSGGGGSGGGSGSGRGNTAPAAPTAPPPLRWTNPGGLEAPEVRRALPVAPAAPFFSNTYRTPEQEAARSTMLMRMNHDMYGSRNLPFAQPDERGYADPMTGEVRMPRSQRQLASYGRTGSGNIGDYLRNFSAYAAETLGGG